MILHLIDGTWELFRQFYGAPGAIGPTGKEVGATRGMLRTLHALLARPDVTHVGIAFDTEITSFRNQLFPGYKTGEGVDPALLAQFPLAERAAEAMGVVTWRMIDFETDDALATSAAIHGPAFTQVRLCSPDKDFAQCVTGEQVVLWDRAKDVVTDENGVHAKWGVAPASIPDWLALVGDSADGIPGLTGWGEKSASTLLAHYRSLSAIPDDPSQWQVKVRGAARLAEVLAARRADAELYKLLATLRRDVPLAESVADLAWRGADQAALASLCEELGFERFLSRPPRFR